MSFIIRHRAGRMERNPDLKALVALMEELDETDAEHPDVAIQHESGWALSAFENGAVAWENVDEGEPRHLLGVSREKLLELASAVARGDLERVECESWRSGYP